MIILNNTSRSLQAVLSGAIATNEPTFICSYVDITSTTFLPATSDGTLNGATAVTIAPAPSASVQRQLKYLSIYNADTAPVIVSLKYVDSTTYVFMKVSLSVSYSLVYDADGWKVITNTGAILTASSGASGGYYQIVESAGSTQPQEDALNFLSAFTVADNPTNSSTDISLAATGVTAATYGDSTHVVQLTINAAGQITSASAIAIGGGTVTTVSVVTNQGVSGTVANASTTPAITISLGALTGVTSLNGLVVTANTGVITTGTWNGTLISNAYGGTGQNSSSSTGVAQLNSGTWSFSTLLANGTTATTQSALDSSTKVATTQYVDAAVAVAVAGMNYKASCRVTSQSALPTNVYSNGSSGVGATLTGVAFGGLAIDSRTIAIGDSILVAGEATQANNGIYTCTATGGVSAYYVLTRRTDYNTSADILSGDAVYVINGSTYQDTMWVMTTVGTITVGTTAIVFSQIGVGSVTSVTAGTGLTGGTITGTGTIALATALPNGETATTQSPLDNSTKVATTAYTDAAVAAATPTNYFGLLYMSNN